MSRPRTLRGSQPFDPQKAMQKILDTLYLHRSKEYDSLEDGQAEVRDRLLSKLFQELPDKKKYADYYEIINKPIALDIIQMKLKKGGYTDFQEFVKDVAQIFHNARVYNARTSQVFQDALALETLLEEELKTLQAKGFIESATVPDLGPIPQSSPVSAPESEPGSDSQSESNSEEDEEDDDGAMDDEDDEYNEKERKKAAADRATRRSTRRSLGAEGGSEGPSTEDKKDDSGANSDETPKPDVPKKRKRGRPPKIDTPEEARIRAILRAIRKVKDDDGRQLFVEFEKLPDPEQYPDYYKEIKKPLALDNITKKIKRRDYKKMDNFVTDMNLMFNNAKIYNADESQIFKDAVTLQETLIKVAEEERKKGDQEYINRGLAKDPSEIEVNEGAGKTRRIPVGHVEANGQRYEIGDWILLTNPNDAEKPIVAQIFKTWKTPTGEQWINVCWYYRPEQTVHRASRKFYENEVFKSGQYRDHPASQILSRTYVQFITRYTRGRPKDWPANEKIWVCESRYNDLSKAFSKINQWRACLPEEVRFDEEDIYLFDRQRQYERFPSPLVSYLKPDEKPVGEGESLPEPIEPGSEEGPPTVGAIYRGDSPEPEKEPTPPPPPPEPVVNQPRPLQPMDPNPHGLPQPMPYKNPTLGQLSQNIYRPLPPRFPSAPSRPPVQAPSMPPVEQPSAFTMPITMPPEVSELVARDNQGRVLWFGVPPVDIVGWGSGEGIRGHTLEYLAKKKRKAEEASEAMQDVQITQPSQDKSFKKQATELLVKALGQIGK